MQSVENVSKVRIRSSTDTYDSWLCTKPANTQSSNDNPRLAMPTNCSSLYLQFFSFSDVQALFARCVTAGYDTSVLFACRKGGTSFTECN